MRLYELKVVGCLIKMVIVIFRIMILVSLCLSLGCVVWSLGLGIDCCRFLYMSIIKEGWLIFCMVLLFI